MQTELLTCRLYPDLPPTLKYDTKWGLCCQQTTPTMEEEQILKERRGQIHLTYPEPQKLMACLVSLFKQQFYISTTLFHSFIFLCFGLKRIFWPFVFSSFLWFFDLENQTKASVAEDFKSKSEKYCLLITVHNYCSLFTFTVHKTVHFEFFPI